MPKVRKIMIPGSNHTDKYYEPLQAELAARGEDDWQAITTPDHIHTLEEMAKYLEQTYPGPKLLICHSLGGPIAAHWDMLGQVYGIFAISPVADTLKGALYSTKAVIDTLGWKVGSKLLSGTGGFPLGDPNLGRLFYADDTPAEEVSRRLSYLRPEPLRVTLQTKFLPARKHALTYQNAVVHYKQDRVVSLDWAKAYAKWLRVEVQEIDGPHNAFEDEAGARLTANYIMPWVRRTPPYLLDGIR